MRTALLICVLTFTGLCHAQGELDKNARTQVIERVLEDLRSDYVFPNIAEQMVASIRERVAAGEYDATTRASDLAAQLTEDLRRVSHDRHLGLLYQPPLPVSAQPPPFLNRARRVNYGFKGQSAWPATSATSICAVSNLHGTGSAQHRGFRRTATLPCTPFHQQHARHR